MDQFETFARLLINKGIPRSRPYLLGLAAKLRFTVQGDRIPKLPYNPGTPELDAYYAGIQHAETFLACILLGDSPDIELLDSWKAIQDLARTFKAAERNALPAA